MLLVVGRKYMYIHMHPSDPRKISILRDSEMQYRQTFHAIIIDPAIILYHSGNDLECHSFTHHDLHNHTNEFFIHG